MVEVFLHSLLRRKCKFHVAFFADNAHLCIPPTVPSTVSSRYLLAREAIIQHLCHNLHRVTPRVGIRLSDGYQSEELKAYLASSGAYFFMCHDGALVARIHPDHAEGELSDSYASSKEFNKSVEQQNDIDRDESNIFAIDIRSKQGFRNMIHWFICHGYNIALVNTLECRDTKVCFLLYIRCVM